MFAAVATVGILSLWGGLRLAAAQDVQLLPCAQVQFFGPACAPTVPPEPRPAAPLAAQPAVPLFAPATMAPDTPPLLLRLLEAPTLEHARDFVAWQRQRDARIREVQQLLRTLTQGETP